MADDNSIGGLAKRWLKSKVTELTSGDRHTVSDARITQNRAEHQLKETVTGEALKTAFPALRRMEEQRDAAKAEREQRYRDEVRAKPKAGVEISVTGDVTGSWSGELPVDVERVPRDRYDAEGESLPSISDDLVVEIVILDEDAPTVGGVPLLGWRLVVPDYRGSGVYDYAAIVREREAAGDELDYGDLHLMLGTTDEPYYWTPDYGPGTVTVDADSGTLDVRMAMQSASSTCDVTGRLTVALP